MNFQRDRNDNEWDRSYNVNAELAKGYEKDTIKLEENLRHVNSWRDEVMALQKSL